MVNKLLILVLSAFVLVGVMSFAVAGVPVGSWVSVTITDPLHDTWYSSDVSSFGWTAESDDALVSCAYSISGAPSVSVACSGLSDSGTESIGPLSDGTYTLVFEASTATGYQYDDISFYVDTTSPDVSITSLSDGDELDLTSVDVSYDFTEANPDACFATVNGVDGAEESCDGSINVNLIEGDNEITISVRDLAGNQNGNSVNVFVDSIAPGVSVVNPSESPVYLSQDYFEVEISVDEANDYTVSFEAQRTSVPYGRQTEEKYKGDDLVFRYPSLGGKSNGIYSYGAGVVDEIGHETTVNGIVYLDTAAPTITDDYANSGSWVNSAQMVTLNPSDSLSGIDYVMYCIGDGCSPSDDGDEIESPYQLTFDENIEEYVRYQAWDMAGNPSDVGEFVMMIDLVAPETSDDVSGDWATGSVDVTLSASDDLSGVAATYYCVGDGEECEDSYSTYGGTFTISSEGVNELRYYSVDDAGNEEDVNVVEVKIDNSAPNVEITAPEAGSWFNNDFAVSRSDSDTLSGLDFCEVQVINNGVTSIDWTTVTCNEDYTVPTEVCSSSGVEVCVVNLRATDKVGLVNTASRGFSMDYLSPATTLSGDPGKWVNYDVDLELSAVDDLSGVAHTYYCVDQEDTCSPSTEGTEISVSSEGANYVRFYSEDNAGNEEGVQTVTIYIDKTNPKVDAGSDKLVNALFSQDATTSDATSGIDSWAWTQESGSGTVTFGSETSEDTTVSADADDVYTIILTVTDAAGNTASDTFTLTWDTLPPVITVENLATTNTTPTLTGSVSDENGVDSVTITVNGVDYTADFGEGVWSVDVTNELSDGLYEVSASATDNAGNVGGDDSSNELYVDTTGPETYFINDVQEGPVQNDVVEIYYEGDIIPESVWPPNYDNAMVKKWGFVSNGEDCYTDMDSEGMEDYDGSFSIDNESYNGQYICSYTQDGLGNANAVLSEYSLNIDTVAPVVTFDSLTTNDNSPTLTGTVDDSEASVRLTLPWSLCLTDIPSSCDVYATNNGDGTWSYEFGYSLNDGDYAITVTATDGAGNEGVDTGVLDVDTTAPEVVITRPENKTYTSSSVYVKFNVSETNGVCLYSIDNGTTKNVMTYDSVAKLFVATMTGLSDKAYWINAYCNDSVGNLNDSETMEFVVDVPAPIEPESSGGSGGGSVCYSDWSCTGWSACVDGTQTRDCTLSVTSCIHPAKPLESQTCTVGGSGTEGTEGTEPSSEPTTETTLGEEGAGGIGGITGAVIGALGGGWVVAAVFIAGIFGVAVFLRIRARA